MNDQTSAFNLNRALRQKLQSLERSGVLQVRHCEPIECSLPAEQPESLAPISETNQSAIESSSAASKSIAGETSLQSAPLEKTDMPKKLSKKAKVEALEILNEQVQSCTLCQELSNTRTQTVFGVGNPNSRVVFFGEAPGADEDAQGEPFVGRAGKLLTKIIEACGFAREDVYIMNTLKCRPPGNRNPAPDEVTNCRPFYERQLEIIRPEFIVCLGSIAATNVLQTKLSIGKLRGTLHDLNGIKVVATYHPAYLLRNPAAKKYVWDDLKMLLTEMGLPIPNAK